MSVAGQWDFTVSGASILKTLNTSGDNFLPREQSFTALSMRLVDDVIIYLYERGIYASAVNFQEIGDIDGETPTDIQDAYDKILALIVSVSQNLNQTTALGNETDLPIIFNDVDNGGLQAEFGSYGGLPYFRMPNLGNGYKQILDNNSSSADRSATFQDRDYTLAGVDEIHENIVKVLGSSPDDEFAFAHGTVTIGNKMFIGTREGADSKLLRYSGTTLEEVITIPCVSGIGIETLCNKSDGSRIYGIRKFGSTSYVFDVDPEDFTDINYNVITGFDLGGSNVILTDDTYVYIGTQTGYFIKILISDWSTVTSVFYDRGLHGGKINVVGGVAYYTSQSGWFAKVQLSDLSYEELDLTEWIQVATDDLAYIDDGSNPEAINVCIVGGETRTAENGKIGAVFINADTMTAYPFEALPTVGWFFNNDFTYLYNVSNEGFIEVYNFNDFQANLLFDITNQYRNTFTFLGNGFPNEMLFPADGSLYMTNWDTTLALSQLSRIELTPFLKPLITARESYFRNLSGGGVTSVNGADGVVVLTQDDVLDGTTYKQYSATEKSKLASITEIFTTALKTAYDSAVTWISTNGSNVLAHLSNTSNPHSVTKSQVGLGNADNTSDANKPISTATQTALDGKAIKPDVMILQSVYAGANSTSLQKMFNVGSSGNGSYNASANKTLDFRVEFEMTGLSSTTGTLAFGFLGTATISKINYRANVLKVGTLSARTAGVLQTVNSSSSTVVTASNANTNVKGVIMGTMVVTGAGTIIPAYTTSVGSASVQTEVGSYFRIVELGSDTFTASSNMI